MTLCMLCISLGIQAHQPDLSSTILAAQDGNKWVLQVRASLTAFEYVVEENFGESSYATPEEFQALVTDYVRKHVSIQFDEDNMAVLQNGMVKLGHETNVIFQIEGVPQDIQSLVVKNTSFSGIPRNQSALLVIKEGFAKDQFTLSNSNEHTVTLKVSDTKFVLVTPADGKASYLPFLILAGALVVFLIACIIFKKRQIRFNPGLRKT